MPMPAMSWLSAFLLLVLSWCLISLLRAIAGKQRISIGLRSKNVGLPPGPPGLPFIGNLLMLGHLPHRTLLSLAKVYGPIMSLRLGLVPTVVVSSPQFAEKILKTHDLVFASRPRMEALKYMGYGVKGLVLTPYGPYWRTARKFCTLQLLSNTKIDSFKSVRREELTLLVKSLKDMASAGAMANLSSEVSGLAGNVICRMLFSRKYMDGELDDKGLKEVIRQCLKLASTFNLADFIPILGPFDVQGLRRRMKAWKLIFDEFCEKIIDERILNRGLGQQMDFVDVMLSDSEFQDDRTSIKGIILDMLAAGMDTSANTIEWALSELLRHPRVMKKVQEELLHVVDMDRMVEESDLFKLDYLDMVIKETFRLHPVAPFLIREAMDDCTLDGFHITKKSRVIVNVFAIGRDPSAWSNAEEFYPERFIGTNIDVRGHDFQLIPFGSGRRSCPGMQLALTMVRLTLAQLIHCFDWELPNGLLPSELDMTEELGLTVPRSKPLSAMPTYRLRCDIIS